MNPLLILLTNSALLACLYFLITKIQDWKHQYHELSFKKKRVTIAIFAPSNKAPLNGLIKGFISYLKKYASFEFETIECITHYDRERTYQWAEYISTNQIDLVYAIGRNNTEAIYHSMKPRIDKTPVVAGGVPLECCQTPLEVIQQAIPFTAVTGSFNWQQKVMLIKKSLPHIKKVLVLFRSIDELSHTNLKEKNSITQALRKYHISWEMHHINNIEASTELTPDLLNDIDLIIITRTGELMPYAKRIAQDSNKCNVPVFSMDVLCQDIFLGIAENTEKSFGELCAKQAMQILEDGTNASDIPPRQLVGPHEVVIFPDNALPLTATTTIGNAINNAAYVKLTLNNK